MDPDMTAIVFLEAVTRKDWEKMVEAAEDLREWIDKDGWIPDRITALFPRFSDKTLRVKIITWLNGYSDL